MHSFLLFPLQLEIVLITLRDKAISCVYFGEISQIFVLEIDINRLSYAAS